MPYRLGLFVRNDHIACAAWPVPSYAARHTASVEAASLPLQTLSPTLREPQSYDLTRDAVARLPRQEYILNAPKSRMPRHARNRTLASTMAAFAGAAKSDGETTYRFERMWPTLQQPWYFDRPSSVAFSNASRRCVL